MGAAHNIASTRPGTPGLDVFKIAGRSISGFLHSFKTGESRQVRLPFTTHLEERLALFLEYHPHVRSYQRGDASVACATTYDLAVPLGTPYRINYVCEGKPHDGWHTSREACTGLAPMVTYQNVATKTGCTYMHDDSRSRRAQEIAAALLREWPYGDMCCVSEFVQRFGRSWSEAEVEAAIWKLVADAAAEGRLLVDLIEVELSHATPLALLAPGRAPILASSSSL